MVGHYCSVKIKMAYNKKFKDIPGIYTKNKSFSSLKATCDYLDELNKILFTCIPEQYAKMCHFGAIDSEKNVAILFISEQQAFHILRTMSEHILNGLLRNNFNFSGILFKVKKYQKDSAHKPHYKTLPETTKNKLLSLAKLVGKENLAINNIDEHPNDDDEICL